MMEFADAAVGVVAALRRQQPEVDGLCSVRALDGAGLRAVCPGAWERLAHDALEDNPWLTRQSVLAGMDADRSATRALALYGRGTGQLAGLLPFAASGVGALGVGRPALNRYQVQGTPLLARELAQPAMATLLGLMASGPGLPRHWVFPHVATQGAFMTLARSTAARLGMHVAVAATYERPVLTRACGSFRQHVEGVLGKKRAKDIERNLRRLGEEGAVAFERAREPELVAERVEAFLRIERDGWKGRRGTAFLSCSRDAEFARRAFAGTGEGRGLASVDSLLLDGRPIAVSINIAAGRTLFTPKCAFDERYRRFGPGMILEYKVIEHFYASHDHAEMDAATTVDGHLVAQLWGRTRTMGTAVIGPFGPTVRALGAMIDGAAAGKRALKRALGRR